MTSTLGLISLAAACAPTKLCEAVEKELYSKLNSLLRDYWISIPTQDMLIVFGDFNATTGTDSASYKLCVGPNKSVTWNDNSSLLLNFARFSINH